MKACLVLALLVHTVYGWGATGHMLVAQIAFKYLSQNPSVSNATLQSLENSINSLVAYSNQSNTFVTAACWMDDIKSQGINQFSDWHYINIPICDYPDSNDTDACNGTSVVSALNGGSEDILWAISSAITTIKSNSAKGFERGFAFRNLLHLVGDLHQPLHAVTRFSPETPNGDAGGNKFKISGSTTNLHSFWDSGLNLLNSVSRPLSASSAAYISNLADDIISKVANLTANVTTYNVTQWAMDSRQLAISYAYNLTYNSVPSADYIALGWPIVEQQLGLAGYRLHLVLNQIALCQSTRGNCPNLNPSANIVYVNTTTTVYVNNTIYVTNTVYVNNTVYVPKTVTTTDSTWRGLGIAVAVGFGISVFVNLGLLYFAWNTKKRIENSGYSRFQEK